MSQTESMHRDSLFSYQCKACCRCCHNKLIQLNAYEIARLARNLGISTGKFISSYMNSEQPYLLFLESSACVFLGEKGCTVHNDRPLVCRLYPLGRHLSGDGVESFSQIDPHPLSEGVYGEDGTLQEFLDQQEVHDFIVSADEYLQLFYRLYDSMWSNNDIQGEEAETYISENLPSLEQWLDMDLAIAKYCAERELSEPEDLAERMHLHILSIEARLALTRE